MYKIKKSKKIPFYKKKAVWLVLVLVLLLAAGTLYARQRNDDSSGVTDVTTPVVDDNVDFTPPTPEEKQETEANKRSFADDSPDSGDNSTGQVVPVITYADRSVVRGYVPGVFEDGGTCTATATKGSQTKTANSEGFEDFNKTTCAPITISLPDGGWSVVLSYNSNTVKGQSETYQVD